MAHYDIFRDQLAIRYPGYGHALWEPSPGDHAVGVGDVGYIYEGRFHRLFNILLPADDPSHARFGVPDNHEPFQPQVPEHITPGILPPDNFCSAGVTLESDENNYQATRPREPGEVSFSCRERQGAVLSLPIQAKRENTVVRKDFGKWIIDHIDQWFTWVRNKGLEINRMEDLVLVTGTDRARSWANIAFLGGQANARVSFGVEAAHSRINWQFLPERKTGAAWNWGPCGEDLPEDQCIFIRGFRVRKRRIWRPKLKAAAGPNPDPNDDDCEPDAELISIPAVPMYRDPLHVLLEYLAQERPDCNVIIVHDDDLALLDVLGDGASLEALQPDVVLSCLRSSNPVIHEVVLGTGLSAGNDGANTDTEVVRVSSLSAIFESQFLRISDSESDRMISAGSLQPPLGTSGLSTTDNMSSPLHSSTSSSHVNRPLAFPDVVPMGKQKSRRQIPSNPVALTSNRLLSRRRIPNNSVAPMDTQKPLRRIPNIRFRVLIIGRANAGKTSILQRVCDTTESPVIYRGNEGIKLDPSMERGEHTIDDELVFSNHRSYIFHDSRGIESGSTKELEILQEFIQRKCGERRLQDKLHAIWYCVPMDNHRPGLDLKFYKNICPDQNVPVVVVFTKHDQFLLNVAMHVDDYPNLYPDSNVSEVAEKQFQERYLHPPLGKDTIFVRLEKMHMRNSCCDKLIEATAAALNDDIVTLMLLAVQRDNLRLCVNTALKRVNPSPETEVKHIIQECLFPFVYIWVGGLLLGSELLEGPDDYLGLLGDYSGLAEFAGKIMSLPSIQMLNRNSLDHHHLILAVIIILKHATLLRLSNLSSELALRKADLHYQQGNVDQKIQEYLTTCQVQSVTQFVGFIIATNIEPMHLDILVPSQPLSKTHA